MNNRKNYGFIILYGFISTSLEAQQGFELTDNQLEMIHTTLDELVDLQFYNDEPLDCPDVRIMTYPQDAFEIFCEFYDENEIYFQKVLVESN